MTGSRQQTGFAPIRGAADDDRTRCGAGWQQAGCRPGGHAPKKVRDILMP
jgi:hypothetical protein